MACGPLVFLISPYALNNDNVGLPQPALLGYWLQNLDFF
jgi:hypothetical protein